MTVSKLGHEQMQKHACIYVHTDKHTDYLCVSSSLSLLYLWVWNVLVWKSPEGEISTEHASTAWLWHSVCIMYKSEMLTAGLCVCVCVCVCVCACPTSQFLEANSVYHASLGFIHWLGSVYKYGIQCACAVTHCIQKNQRQKNNIIKLHRSSNLPPLLAHKHRHRHTHTHTDCICTQSQATQKTSLNTLGFIALPDCVLFLVSKLDVITKRLSSLLSAPLAFSIHRERWN